MKVKCIIVDDEATVKEKLSELRNRVMQGEKFKELAKQYSQDPISAAKGGDLGWVPPGVMVPEFEKVMQQQAVNTISEPFRTEYGWHILMVKERREKENTTEYYTNELRKKIYQRKFVEESQNFLRRLRSSSFVETKLSSQKPSSSTKHG